MAYTKTNWQDLPNQTTPINATNLNKMEQGIKDNDDKLTGATSMGNIQTGYITQQNPSNRLGSNLVLRGTSTYEEASINVGNHDGTKSYIMGYGVGGDGVGIYSTETSQTLATINKNGDLVVMGNGGNIASRMVLNNITLNNLGDNYGSGFYEVYATGNYPTDFSGDTWFYVYQFGTTNDQQWKYQEIVHWWESSGDVHKYVRRKISGTWEGWKRVW